MPEGGNEGLPVDRKYVSGITHAVFQPGMGPSEYGEAYRPYQKDGEKPFSVIDRIAEQKRVEEVSFNIFFC